MKLAAIIVVYNPTISSIKSIVHNAGIFTKTYIVDNSDINDGILIKAMEGMVNVEYLPLYRNDGIARALNIGITSIIFEGYEWVITLDQDSILPKGYIEQIYKVLSSHEKASVGIISPVHLKESLPIERLSDIGDCQEVASVMMSGNLLSVKAFKEVGGFKEDFFMDYVDTEFCLRLRAYGFKVIICKSLEISHELGNSKWYNLMGLTLKPTNHSYIRRYYITRNRIYTLLRYYKQDKRYARGDLFRLMKEMIYIILFERQKIRKVRASLIGAIDGYKGRLGKVDLERI